MSQPPVKQPDPREIAKWAEQYARSRTIPFLVQWVFIVALVLVIGTLAYVAIAAYQTHHTKLMWTCMGVIALTTLALMWFSAAKWGGEQIWRISQWLYGKEGYAAYSGGDRAQRMRRAWWLPVVCGGLGVYVFVIAILAGLRHLPMSYIQPLLALYMVPFLSVMIVTQRLGVWAWVWPLLYGLHAVAILAGAPQLTDKWFPFGILFDILAPIFGYGLIALVAGHVYSRYALRRLKALVRSGMAEDGEPPKAEDE